MWCIASQGRCIPEGGLRVRAVGAVVSRRLTEWIIEWIYALTLRRALV